MSAQCSVLSAQCSEACPQTPPPAKQSFAPKCVPKLELGNERVISSGRVLYIDIAYPRSAVEASRKGVRI
jgi:hypothetical protein